MYEPEDLARYLSEATADTWTVSPLPQPIYGKTIAACASSATTTMYAVVVDVPFLGMSLHVVVNAKGQQHASTVELRGRTIQSAIIRAADILAKLF